MDDDGTLGYKINSYTEIINNMRENNSIFRRNRHRASPEEELYTEILKFLQEKKLEQQNPGLVEEAKVIGQEIEHSITKKYPSIPNSPRNTVHNTKGV